MTELDTPLPTLSLDAEMAWRWPTPPFVHRQVTTPLDTGEQPCSIETPEGATVESQLVGFDVDAGQMRVRMHPDGEPVALWFSKIRRVTLTTPWPIARHVLGVPDERSPHVMHERGYCIELASGGELAGRTLGHVKQSCGMFLFAPLADQTLVQRVFVPAASLVSVSFGPSAEEQAAARWISTPGQLTAALDAQKTAQIRPLGQALLDLGLVTPSQLEKALSAQGHKREAPLGESLVAQGVIDAADLQTALAYKMGYPMVDLTRFPMDKSAARKLPQAAMLEYSAVPLMEQGDRLIVAIGDLTRVPKLQGSRALVGLKLVPVLACRSRIALALSALPQRLGTDRWSDNVSLQASRSPLYAALTGDTDFGRLATY